jgi:hypothetical protein
MIVMTLTIELSPLRPLALSRCLSAARAARLSRKTGPMKARSSAKVSDATKMQPPSALTRDGGSV